MKQKKAKLYIPIPKEKFLGVEYKQVRVTLVNANKIEELEPILPCEEALSIYMQIQKLSLQKDKNYKPKPMELYIKRSIFNVIIDRYNLTQKDSLALVLSWPAVPICLILPKD